jgi:ABC-type glycerol-3-phosphate transport system permease component
MIIHSKNRRSYVLHLLLLSLGIVTLLPIIWIIGISLSPPDAVLQRFAIFLPSAVQFSGYTEVFNQTPYVTWFRNSLLVTTLITFGQTLTGVLAAYGFSRWKFPGNSTLFFIVICTMMIPPQTIMLPLFMVINQFGWINRYEGLIIPHLAHGYVIFMLRQFFLQVPTELDEASRIDGCTSLQTLYHVYMTSSLPAIVSVILIQVVRNWNEYYWTLVVISERMKLTLPVAIVSFRDETLVQWVPTMASASLSILPIIVLYILSQKYFHQTHMTSGIK